MTLDKQGDLQYQIAMVRTLLAILTLFFVTLVTSQVYQINLDLPPTERYTSVSLAKKQLISNFISYLKKNVKKYKLAFSTISKLHALSPKYFRNRVGREFYDQCLSISKGASLPISDIIVFNYMYQLGAATDFCTAITYSYNGQRIFGRNLDYGYQQFLANNSVHLKYLKNGEVVFQTLAHAGFIGTHTVLKKQTKENPFQFAVTMNERVQGGLHKTLLKIAEGPCQSSSYALMKALKQCAGNIEQFVKYLNNINTCSAVYWTILSKQGRSFVIEKNRGIGSHHIREANSFNDVSYIVQTNHDYDKPDPDTRSTAANQKLINYIKTQNSLTSQNIWTILTEDPNFNKLTLMTGMIDVKKGEIQYKIW